MKKFLTSALLMGMATAASAQEQLVCKNNSDMASILMGEYGETLHSFGITSDGTLLQIYANEETDTWTATIAGINGISCIATHGSSFTVIPPLPEGEES